jgi:hypothetical protein
MVAIVFHTVHAVEQVVEHAWNSGGTGGGTADAKPKA